MGVVEVGGCRRGMRERYVGVVGHGRGICTGDVYMGEVCGCSGRGICGGGM